MSNDEDRDDSVDALNAARWSFLALILGYNELAKTSKTLGERVFMRLARGEAEKEYRRYGGELRHVPVEGDDTILELTESLPGVVFQERDIELMRRAVQEYDAKKAKGT